MGTEHGFADAAGLEPVSYTHLFLGKIAGNEKALRIIGRNADLPQGRLYLFGCGGQV